MDKLATISQGAQLVEDGMTIGIGGWGPRRKPMALVRELIRLGRKDLTVVSYGGCDVGMLVAAGMVKKLVFAFVSLDFIPLEPFFRKSRQDGDIEIMEIDEGMMLLGLKAAAMGAPFIPTKVGLGTDVISHNPDLKVIQSPYDEKDWVAMPALKLDVSFVHVDSATRNGVCVIEGPDHYMDDLFVRAADKSVVSCERVLESSEITKTLARSVFWERSATHAVVPIQGGAHPSSHDPLYGFDVSHIKSYVGCAKDGGFESYLENYVLGSETEYQNKVGGIDHIRSLPLPVY